MDIPSTDVSGEKRWPMAITLIAAMALPFLLPPKYSFAPRWVIPVIEAVLLLRSYSPTRVASTEGRPSFGRFPLGLVVILVAGATGATVRLVIDLVKGGVETNSPSGLLRIGAVVWVYVIITFSFLYWELDGGGPEARARSTPEFPDLAFPEHLNPRVAPPGWRPEFFDYLYLGFTDSTAFSPTDVMPIARWAKLAMALQATASLIILGLVIARAVNIFK